MDRYQVLGHGIVLSGATRQCAYFREHVALGRRHTFPDGELNDFPVTGHECLEGSTVLAV